MGILLQFLLISVVWYFFDQVHSFPSHVDAGSLPLRSSVKSLPLKGAFSECGVSKKTEEDKLSIVNGRDAILGDWPWMVALFEGSPTDKHLMVGCGGSLISNQWVLTAAHCVTDDGIDTEPEDIFVRLGDLNVDDKVKDGALPIDALVDRIVIHSSYPDNLTNYDIALIHMKDPIRFTENIRPICLPHGGKYQPDEFYEGKQSAIIGWGLLGEEDDVSKMLQEAFVDISNFQECQEKYATGANTTVEEATICAGGTEADTCQGDSGGPLMILDETEERYYLVGITSSGQGCNAGYPGLYTKVASYMCWISDVTGEDF